MLKIHLIGNAHLDPVWLWQWQEGYSEVLATFRSALDRIKEFDDFIFTSAAVIYYEWIEETDPDMFEEIKQRVKEGKWVLAGGWLVQPDCNLPCGESFARHSLYGQNYFKEKFGIMAKTGYNVDSFGHSAMLPQILKKSGMDNYVYMRPNEFEKEYEFKKNTFLWVAPDGSSVKAFRVLEPYCTTFIDTVEKAEKEGEIADKQQEDLMSFYGVGNHGGGPTIKSILALKELMKKYEGRYAFSSPDRFFKEINANELPVYSGDLFHHASGCYSSVMQIKALNRKSESALLNAEKAGVMAVLADVKQNTENFKEAWKPTLFNQFHDIMCGCCIKDAVDDAVRAYGGSITSAEISQNRFLQAIAWNIDTSKEQPVILDKTDFKVWEKDNAGTPFVVFNMNSFDVTTPVKLGTLVSAVEDDEGNPVPAQKVRARQTNISPLGVDNWESEILAEVPAMGWRLYWIYKHKENKSESRIKYNFSERNLENDWIKVSISEDGYIDSIYDKVAQKEMLKNRIEHIVLDETDYDTWAHGIFEFNNVIGKFENAKVIFAKQGELKQEVRIEYKYGNSTLLMDVTLHNDLKEVFLDFKVNWQEKHKMLKISLPTVLEYGKEVASVPYGFIERDADGKEHPMQKWLLVKNSDYGVGIATDTRTAYDLKNGNLRITALRSPVFADHFGKRDECCEYTEQGEQKFKIAIKSMASGNISELYKLSELMLTPLTAILGTYHKGKLKPQDSMINVSAENVAITAFKGAEDGNGYIIHCHEIEGRECETQIIVKTLGINFKAHFGAQEIKCFRLCDGVVAETDFLESEF